MGQGVMHTEEQITAGLIAVAAHAGNYTNASRSITQESHGFTVAPQTLSDWVKHRYPERYAELREKVRDQIEKQLADRQTDAAALATETAYQAVERAKERLEHNADQDPARTAANLATVQEKMMRASLTLQNRPSTIKETRNPQEILRGLIGSGVFKIDGDVLQAPWLDAGEPEAAGTE